MVDVKNVFVLQGHILSTSGDALIATPQLHTQEQILNEVKGKIASLDMQNDFGPPFLQSRLAKRHSKP
jgi:hypothetical protein